MDAGSITALEQMTVAMRSHCWLISVGLEARRLEN
jgi:hypothetical protein